MVIRSPPEGPEQAAISSHAWDLLAQGIFYPSEKIKGSCWAHAVTQFLGNEEQWDLANPGEQEKKLGGREVSSSKPQSIKLQQIA